MKRTSPVPKPAESAAAETPKPKLTKEEFQEEVIRRTKEIKASQSVKLFDVDVNPPSKEQKEKQKKRLERLPRTKDGGVHWQKYLPQIVTKRPEGMSQEDYKKLLKEQKRQLKHRK